MAYEDFTTYTETDPNNRYTVTATKVDANLVSRNEDCYVYDDKGAGNFGDFEHDVEGTFQAASGDGAVGIFWAVSNVVDDAYAWAVGAAEAISARFDRSGVTNRVKLSAHKAPSNDTSAFAPVLGTKYYFTVVRSGTSCELRCYSNSVRTDLLDTLVVSVAATETYRYVFAANSWNSGAGMTCSWDTENLILDPDYAEPTGTTLQRIPANVFRNPAERRVLQNLLLNRNAVEDEMMRKAVYDAGEDNKIDTAAGGTGMDTSRVTGVPKVVSGTWRVPAKVEASMGGTGQDTSGSSGVPKVASGTWSVPAKVEVELGGTEQDSSAWTGVVYTSTGTWAVEAQVANSRGGTGQNSAAWSGLARIVSGVWSALAQATLALGGTGQDFSAVTKGSIIVCNANGVLALVQSSTEGDVPTVQADGTVAWAAAGGGADTLVVTSEGYVVVNGDGNIVTL